MSKQTINIGASPNDGTGTPLRTSFDYTNQNFTELYTALGGGVGLPGATTQVIFNDGGTNLAGDAGLVYNKTTDALTVAGLVTAGSATITGALTVDTTTLVVDATNNRVGIGTATPLYTLDVNGNARIGTDGLGFGRLTVTKATSAATLNLSLATATGYTELLFTNFNDNTGASGFASYIRSNTNAAGNYSSDLVFGTSPQASGGPLERYKIASDGVATWSYVGGVAGTAMTLNSTGLGVGVVPSAGKFEVLEAGTGSGFGGIFASTATAGGNPGFVFRTASTNRWSISLTGTAGAESIRFYDVDASATRMTLDASGNLLVGTTNTSATAGPGFKSQFSSTVSQFAIVVNEAGTSTSLSIYNVSAAAYRFYVNNGGTVFATNTVISAISDARLKENVQDIDVGLNAILSLKPRKFDWKAGKGKDIKGDRGFIAQEFEAVFPNLVDEWKDQAPEGESPYKSVRQDLIPVLVKAIQELTTRVQTLEAR